MRTNGLRSQWKRKFVHATDSRHGLPVAANVLERGFNPGAPDQAWVCDITYIRTRSGWLYLAAVLDLYSRRMRRIHDGRLIAQYDYPHDDRKNVAARRRAPGWVRCVPE